ncbi:unnamed protein product, partial [Adineta steineri]
MYINSIYIIGKQHILQSDLLFNCSGFTTDDDILQSFPFKVELNPIIRRPEITYGLLDDNYNIYFLNIFNESYFPSSGFCFKHLKQLDVRRTNFKNGNDTIPAEIKYLASTLIDL